MLEDIKLDDRQKELISLLKNITDYHKNRESYLMRLGRKIFQNSKSDKEKISFYVHGGVGRGKTMIAKAFYEEFPISKLFIHYQDFMKNIHTKMHENKGVSKNKILRKIAKEYGSKYQFIAIDEFEVHDIADAMIIAILFDALMDENIHFLITSNAAPDELYKNGLQREQFMPFIRMMKEEFHIYPLDNNHDYRLDKIQTKSRILHPLSQQNQQKMDEIEERLIGDHQTQEVELNLFGRKMQFKRAYKTILFTDFDELCRRSLSSNDYIELGKKFEVIIVENVPIIAEDETDLAIRFINFIDNVYFYKVLLFISLATSPEKIYPRGRRVSEFKRTISRLHEINSESYLKNSKHQ